MAKEFLQKHFINDVKAILGHGSNSAGNANANVKLQDIVITKNGIYKPDEGFDAFGEVTINIGGASAEPAIAAGLYTDNTYSTMTTSWQDLLDAGVVHVDNGVVYTNMDMDTWENNSAKDLVGVLVLPDDGSVTALGDYNDNEFTGRPAFMCCGNLSGIIIPNTVTTISDYAVAYCAISGHVTIPDGVTAIGMGAFEGNSGITSVEIPVSLTTFGSGAFLDNATIKELHYKGTFEDWNNLTNNIPDCIVDFGVDLYIEGEKMTDVIVPDNITSLGRRLFTGYSITSVEIPSSVTSIENGAFYYCESLTSVTVLGEVPPTIIFGISNGLFEGCTALTAIKVPASSVDAYKSTPGWSEYASIIVPIA